MRRWTLLTIASLLAVGLGGCTGVGATDVSAQAPVWSAGHSWSYEWETEYTLESEQERGEEWSSSDEDAVFTVVANITPLDQEPGWLLLKEHDIPNGFIFPWGELMFMREADMTPMRGDELLAWGCGYGDDCDPRYDRYGDVDDDRSGPFIDFPIHTGKTWTYEIFGDRFQARVVGPSAIDVGAGRYQAIHIQYVLTDSSDDAEEMEEYGATVHKYEIQQAITMDVHYVPEVEWVASYDVDARATFDIDIEWPDGERYTDQGTHTMTQAISLTEFDLAEEEPLSADELAQRLDIQPFPEISGPGPYIVESNVTVEATLSADEVNIADDPTVVFEASATGDAASYNHTWVIREQDAYYYPYYGEPEDGVEGGVYEHLVEDVGRYTTYLYTYDDQDRLVDIQELDFEAYYETSGTGACGVHAAYVAETRCEGLDFPIRGWDLNMVITASYEGDGVLEDPQLVVLDARGYEAARKQMAGDETTIDAEARGDSGVWTTYVEPPTGTEGSVHYTVRVEQMASPFYYH